MKMFCCFAGLYFSLSLYHINSITIYNVPSHCQVGRQDKMNNFMGGNE